jgi:hypothetical protein
VLLLSMVPSTEQKPVWVSSRVILTPVETELELEDREELDSELDDLDEEDMDDREDEETEEEETDEREDDTEEREELERLDDRLEDIDDEVRVPPHMLPVTVGVSTAPFAFTCTPNATVWPGCMPAFQLRLVAL